MVHRFVSEFEKQIARENRVLSNPKDFGWAIFLEKFLSVNINIYWIIIVYFWGPVPQKE